MPSKNVEIRIIRGEEIGRINRARCSSNCHVKHGRFAQVALFDIDRVYRRVLRVTVRPEKSWFKRPYYFVRRRLCRSAFPTTPWLPHTFCSPFFIIPRDSVARFVPLCSFLLPGLYNIRSLVLIPHCDFLKAPSGMFENYPLTRYGRYLEKENVHFLSVIGVVAVARQWKTADCRD